jgi:hypothetical protein
MTTESVVAVLVAAGLAAEVQTRRTRRAGFRVRQCGRDEVGVSSDTMTADQWAAAMRALEVAGYVFTYRSDPGMGARVTQRGPI